MILYIDPVDAKKNSVWSAPASGPSSRSTCACSAPRVGLRGGQRPWERTFIFKKREGTVGRRFFLMRAWTRVDANHNYLGMSASGPQVAVALK